MFCISQHRHLCAFKPQNKNHSWYFFHRRLIAVVSALSLWLLTTSFFWSSGGTCRCYLPSSLLLPYPLPLCCSFLTIHIKIQSTHKAKSWSFNLGLKLVLDPSQLTLEVIWHWKKSYPRPQFSEHCWSWAVNNEVYCLIELGISAQGALVENKHMKLSVKSDKQLRIEFQSGRPWCFSWTPYETFSLLVDLALESSQTFLNYFSL